MGGADCAGMVAHWRAGPGFNAAQPSLMGQVALGELIIVVLGALVITSEYSAGMIRTSLAVMPRRGVLYAAKALVFAAVSFAVSLVTSFAAFFAGQAILASKHIDTTLTQPYVLRAVLLSAAVVTVFGLFAYGAGAIIRNTAGAITAILGVIFLLPLLGQALPTAGTANSCGGFPGATALDPISAGGPGGMRHLFSAWGEFAVFCGYAAVVLAVGAWLFSAAMRETAAVTLDYAESVERVYPWLRARPWLADAALAVVLVAGSANVFAGQPAVLPVPARWLARWRRAAASR